MNKLTAQEFAGEINKIKLFMAEQDKLDLAIKIISPSGTGVVEFGSEFLMDYIKLLAKVVGDNYGWIEWYIFENDFGLNKYVVTIDSIDIEITNAEELLNVIQN